VANKFRFLVDPIYPNGFTSLEQLTQWMRKVYDKLMQVEEWHEIGDTNEPAFANSWVNFGSPYNDAGFYKDPQGRVHLKGLIKLGTVGSAAFTLPVGYRPDNSLILSTISNSSTGRINLTSGGAVIPVSPSNNTWVALDGLSFRSEQ
jgi:hypothetical protein